MMASKAFYIDDYYVIIKTKRSYIKCATDVYYWVDLHGKCILKDSFEWADKEQYESNQNALQRAIDIAEMEISILRLLTDDNV